MGTLLALLISYAIASFYGLYIASMLALLEVALSFDNAIVNAKVLESMSQKWRK